VVETLATQSTVAIRVRSTALTHPMQECFSRA